MSSEIKNPSISSKLDLSVENINLNDTINTFQKITNQQNQNKNKIEHLNNISDYSNENDDMENATKGSKITLASNTYDNSFIQNNLYNEFSNKMTNSTDSLFLQENHEHFKYKQPVMGKAALIKKSNLDHSDSFIVHSIILNKYEDILNHYVNKMYKRRASRMSNSEDEYSESYTMPRYSPSSVSSIETPRSMVDSQKNFGDEKKFYSADDISIESPQENSNNNSSLTCYSHFDNRTSTSCSEYDPKKFLVNALGDLASLESVSKKCTTNTSQICEESMGTSRISSLISKTNSFCSSLKRSLVRKNSQKCCVEGSPKHKNLISENRLEKYKKELSRQNSIIFQISKALNVCKTSKDFSMSTERLEAEKILLLATKTKEALISEINTIEFDTYRSIFDSRCTGQIKITKITLNLKEKIDLQQNMDYEEHFLVVLTCGKNVLSSDILKENNGVLMIEKIFSFHDLLTDFEIDLCVYLLEIIIKDSSSLEQFRCPSPKSIFKCNRESKNCKISNNTKTSQQIAFIPIGRCHIRNSDISNIKNDILSLHLQDSLRSSLQPSFNLQIESSFQLTNRLTGFLTIGLDDGEKCLTWNRRWCVLDGFCLKYWNYPSEETSASLGQIDIRYCTVQNILLADRSICARPKTLSLPIKDSKGLIHYFLSADTSSDLQMWDSELNFVIQYLLIWHGIKVFF